MLRTALGVGFIAAVATGGVVAALRPTVAHGDALVPFLCEEGAGPRAGRYHCDDRVPITRAGAHFRCTVVGDDGGERVFAIAIDRDGTVHHALVP